MTHKIIQSTEIQGEITPVLVVQNDQNGKSLITDRVL